MKKPFAALFLAPLLAAAISGAALEAILGRMDPEDLPAAVRGAPALFLCAALLAMALMGFHGLSI